MARAGRRAQEAPEQPHAELALEAASEEQEGQTRPDTEPPGERRGDRTESERRPRGRSRRDGPPAGSGATLETRNEVVLVGRVAAAAEERALPSGDAIVVWRLVVDRPPSRRPVPAGVRVPTVDTLDCVGWAPGVRRTARGLSAGDVVAVEGALRRRFWRAGTGAVSRCEVEVAKVKRLARTG